MTVYPGLVEMGHALIADLYSSRLIQPGIEAADACPRAFGKRSRILGIAGRRVCCSYSAFV